MLMYLTKSHELQQPTFRPVETVFPKRHHNEHMTITSRDLHVHMYIERFILLLSLPTHYLSK
jgi:hypothetical protein